MKPTYLSFCGINSFSERAEIDFEQLLQFGIFGIFGDTGSGKSTILDCIGFALYGNVARSRSGSIADVINYNTDRADVQFEFEIFYDGSRRKFRVERELKRKNAAQSAKVFERDKDRWVAVADGVRESNALLERIIGLEQKDFEKCIALPQGEFAQFVKSARSDRLKLVSRLFDLESYGDALIKRAGGKLAEARNALDVTNARLEQYAQITKETVETLAEEVKTLAARETALQTSLTSIRKEKELLAEKVRRRVERERVAAEMAKLEARREEMKTLSGELDRLDRAAAAVKAAREAKDCRLRAAEREKNLQAAQARVQRAEETERALAAWNAAEAEERERVLAERIAAAKARQVTADELARAKEHFAKAERSLAEERTAFRDFSYDEERAKLERAAAALGTEDFVGYLETHAKSLFKGEYAQFASELRDLTEKYGEIGDDSRPLIEKYDALAAGERPDLDALRAQFEARQKERADVERQKLMLEKAKGRYDLHLENLRRLSADLDETKARIARLSEGAVPEEEPVSAMEERLAALRAERSRHAKETETARNALAEARTAHARAASDEAAAREAMENAAKRLSEALAAGNFQSAEEAIALSSKYGDPAAARARVEKFRDDWAATRSKLRELSAEELDSATDEAYRAVAEKLSAAEAEAKTCSQTLAVRREALTRAEAGLKEKYALEKERAEKEKRAALYERLRKLLEGNKFMEFAAEEYLQTVAANATRQLLTLTDGRYCLRYDRGFFVGDNFNGGQTRGVYTLSGGETFLVSLSLALALSAEICRKSLRPIEFFFLDEGFGTLDEHLVDVVMDSLEKLKGEHFSIGIISHVEELKHRIDRKLSVKKATERHGSQIFTE